MMAVKGFLEASRKVVDGIDLIIKAVIVISIAVMLGVICLQVFFRFVLNSPLAWPEELARFAMIWSSLLAAVYVQLERGHLSLDFFVKHFPPKVSICIRILMNIIIIIFMVVVVFGGIQEAYTLMGLKTGALRVSRAVPYLAIPVTCGLFALVTMFLVFKDIAEIVRK